MNPIQNRLDVSSAIARADDFFATMIYSRQGGDINCFRIEVFTRCNGTKNSNKSRRLYWHGSPSVETTCCSGHVAMPDPVSVHVNCTVTWPLWKPLLFAGGTSLTKTAGGT